jgi:hypothetical protein
MTTHCMFGRCRFLEDPRLRGCHRSQCHRNHCPRDHCPRDHCPPDFQRCRRSPSPARSSARSPRIRHPERDLRAGASLGSDLDLRNTQRGPGLAKEAGSSPHQADSLGLHMDRVRVVGVAGTAGVLGVVELGAETRADQGAEVVDLQLVLPCHQPEGAHVLA